MHRAAFCSSLSTPDQPARVQITSNDACVVFRRRAALQVWPATSSERPLTWSLAIKAPGFRSNAAWQVSLKVRDSGCQGGEEMVDAGLGHFHVLRRGTGADADAADHRAINENGQAAAHHHQPATDR